MSNNFFSSEVEMNNPVKDFNTIIEHCSPKIKSYFETREKDAFRMINKDYNFLTKTLANINLYKFKNIPNPKVIQNAKTQTIMIFYTGEKGQIVTPMYKIEYKHTPQGLKLSHRYDTEIFTLEGLINELKEDITNEKIFTTIRDEGE